ncbi:MAG: hypothetical protein ABI832_01135 [bacterium]
MATITGTDQADTLAGTVDADTLLGLEGNDTLFGSADADLMDGGSDTDTADYSASGAAVQVSLASGAGIGGDADGDTLISIENLVGSSLNDLLIGSTDANQLDGGNGDDVLIGGMGADTLIGGAGIDTTDYSASSAVSVDLSSGTGLGGEAEGDTYSSIENVIGSDFADVITGSDADNLLQGGAGNDTIDAGQGNDTVQAGGDDDWVSGSLGNDVLDGGTGINTLDYSAAGASVTVNMASGTTTGALGNDTISNFQNLIGSASNDSLTGDAQDNIIIGGAGVDTMSGGDGIDTVDYSTSGAYVKVYLASGLLGVHGDAQGDNLSQFENITGSAFNDSLSGDGGDNVLDGGTGNDTLVGGGGNDTLIGGEGTNDSMIGGAGDDTYYVDSTNDRISEQASAGTDQVFSTASYTLSLNLETLTLVGSDDIDGTGNSLGNLLIGNAGNNVLDGGSGNDTLTAGDGNDTLIGSSGTNDMSGGDGDDSYYVINATDTLHENADEGHDTIISIFATTLGDNFEDLTLAGSAGVAGTGNAADNVIQGNSGANYLTGADGNDSLIGDVLSDTLHGGNDTLDGGSGDNTLVGGNGNDTYILTTGTDTIVEQADGGIDVVQTSQTYVLEANLENLILGGADDINGAGNALANAITGNTGDNLLFGDAGNDTLSAGDGDDTLNGGTEADSMVGGSGSDLYIVDNIDDRAVEALHGGDDEVRSSVTFTLGAFVENLTGTGSDAIDLTGNSQANEILGNDAENFLSGGGGDDTMIGNLGNDTLDGGNGADSMVGGDDDDTYVVNDAGDETVELSHDGHDQVFASINWSLSSNIEDLTLTGKAALKGTGNATDNIITGNVGNNVLSGNNGNDTLFGGNGNDKLTGGSGDDSMVGGNGNDRYDVNSVLDVVVEDADGGTDTVTSDFSYILGDNIEKLILDGSDSLTGTGNELDNTLKGNSGDNVLDGAIGNDNLIGGNGDDTLIGGTGADTMSGGQGADTYYVDNVGDVVMDVSANQIDSVISTIDYTLGNYVDNLNLVGSALNGTGNSLANEISGNSNANLLLGGSGNDTLLGGGGSDTLNGGNGNDSMVGGNGDDTYIVSSTHDIVSEIGTGGHDTVQSSVNFTLGAGVDDLTLTGTARIAGTGSADANVIIGNSGSNNITGMEGNDTLTGGEGADRFIFHDMPDTGSDTITDFNGIVSGVADGDKLQFDAGQLTDHFDYIGNTAFTGDGFTEARIFSNGRVVMDFNGDGSGDLTIFLTGLTDEAQLSITDFVFG